MALSRLTITFNEELIATEQISFDIYNTNTLTTESIPYVWVNDNRAVNEVLISGLSAPVVGQSTAGDYFYAISFDYLLNTSFTYSVTGNIITLEAKSEDLIFQNTNNFGNNVDFVITAFSPPVPLEKDSYFFEFNDVKGILHRVNIAYSPNINNWIEVTGDCSLEYPEEKDIQEPIKPSNLSINILATQELSFNDLNSEEERVYKVEYIRDGQSLFNGWLSTDGLYENFVVDKWYLQLNAIDGFGYLQDLSYVENETGLNFFGKQSGLQIIKNCLKRTNIEQGIRTSINIYYSGLSSVDVLSNIYFNTERFIKVDENTVMDCKEVLTSILDIFNATIISAEGYWYIYRTNEVFNSSNLTFYNYDDNGVLVVGENTIIKEISLNIGSDIDSYYPHHANANQTKSIQRSLGGYKLNFKYGKSFPFFNNTDLIWNNSTNIDNWTINVPSEITPYYSLRAFMISRPASGIQIVATSDTYTVSGTPRVEFNITFSNTVDDRGTAINTKVKYVKGVNTYWLTRDGNWSTDSLIQYAIGGGTTNFNLKVISDFLPEADGDLFIELYNAGFGDAKAAVVVNKVVIKLATQQEDIQGLNFYIQKLKNITPNIEKKVKEVYNGDVVDNTYYSTIYKNDQITETDLWSRDGVLETKPLLRINVEDRLRMNYNSRVIFEGDVYGYIPYFTRLNINNVKSKMMPISYNYNCKDNLITLKSLELLDNNFLDNDIEFSLTEDYGNVVRPTITG